MTDRATNAGPEGELPRRQQFVMGETGFDAVPCAYRRFYRQLEGADDPLAPNEALCTLCLVVIRSTRELWPGDRIYCMPCFSRLVVVRNAEGRLEAHADR